MKTKRVKLNAEPCKTNSIEIVEDGENFTEYVFRFASNENPDYDILEFGHNFELTYEVEEIEQSPTIECLTLNLKQEKEKVETLCNDLKHAEETSLKINDKNSKLSIELKTAVDEWRKIQKSNYSLNERIKIAENTIAKDKTLLNAYQFKNPKPTTLKEFRKLHGLSESGVLNWLNENGRHQSIICDTIKQYRNGDDTGEHDYIQLTKKQLVEWLNENYKK